MMTLDYMGVHSRQSPTRPELPLRQRTLYARCFHPSGAFEPFPLEAIDQSVTERFEEIVRRYPDRLAVHSDTSQMNYEALNRSANRIAHAILDRRGERPEPIAILMEKDLPAVAAGIGVLKAGKILVPFDPSFPEARLAALLEECRAPIVLTTRRYDALTEALTGTRFRVLNVETLDGAPSTKNPGLALGPDTLGLISYTSGSTGKPKGVVNDHRGLLHHAMRRTNALHIGTEDRMALLGAMSAGQALAQLYLSLLNGAAVFLRDLKERGLADLALWLNRERVTCYRSSASIFRRWAAHLTGTETFPALRILGLGGEPLHQHDFELYRRHFGPDCLFVNSLSSTETGVVCMNVLDHESEISGHFVPVGYPVEDTQVLLLDETGAEVGAGDVGEIAVRTRGLFVGYWQQEDLTRTKFPVDPGAGDMRTYLMGDLGRLAPDGCLVHLGRGDRQVKIRGHRIELGEIESALGDSDAVRLAVVVDWEDPRGEKRLVAYIVPKGGERPTRGALHRFLRERLPDYMVPFAFSFVDELPLTPGGKIDRQALPPFVLPALDGREADPRRGADPASLGLLGTQLGTIWEDLLGVTGVGVHDDFVDLGGDSLLAIEMIIRIEEMCGRTLAPSRLLDGGITIARLVQVLRDDEQARLRTPVTAVQAGGSRRPIFFAHGDFEYGGLYCHNLARHLGPDQPLYAVTPHGLDGGPLPWSIETMAADRIEALKAVQPTGPYRLGGLCNGGVLAFEMARQLQSRGEAVEALLLVDSRAVNAPRRYRLLSRAIGRLARSLDWSDAKRRTVFLRLRRVDEACTWTVFLRLRRFVEAYKTHAKPSGEGRGRFVFDKVRTVLKRWFWPTAGERSGPPPPPAYVQRLRDCLRDYVPGRYQGRVALFRSNYLVSRPPKGLTAGWDHFAPTVDVHPLPGNHELAVTRYVSVLAEKMRPYLA
jgi:amino acid adenylation domain-containing protein